MDPFLFESIKNPLSAPVLILVQLVLLIIIFSKITIKELFAYKSKILLLVISFLLFLLSSWFLFYKMAEVPPAGFVDDDALIVTTAYVLKNTGKDSYGNPVPYFPYLLIRYHNAEVGGGAPIGVPVYFQSFLQYFVTPGHFSLRLECSLLMFLTSVVLIFSFFLLTNHPGFSLLCGTLFNVLPWTRILAKVTPQTTAYCFASACFLFSVFYLIRNKNKHGIFLYLVSILLLYLSYTPGLLLAALCGLLIPLLIAKHSGEYKDLKKKLIIPSFILFGILYFFFRDEQSFIWNMTRAQGSQGLQGVTNLNISEFLDGLYKNAGLYLANFLGYLLPQFLFFSGDSNPRHNTAFGGQLFVSLIIAFYLGLFNLLSKKEKTLDTKILLSYLLISNIPASICLEGGLEEMTKLPLHALRASCMLPVLVIITTLGLVQIFKANRYFLLAYLLVITFNGYKFYAHYFTIYLNRLGNSWIAEPSLGPLSSKALKIIKKHPERKLFYSCALSTVAYYNIDKIGLNSLQTGGGLLSGVYHYYNRGNVEPKKGDLFLVQEPFDYTPLGDKYKFIDRVRNKYLQNDEYGASLFEIVE